MLGQSVACGMSKAFHHKILNNQPIKIYLLTIPGHREIGWLSNPTRAFRFQS